MTITYNGEPLTTDATTVFDLVMEQFGTDAGVAVALNRSIVPRSTWKDSALNDGDRVDALTAVQGATTHHWRPHFHLPPHHGLRRRHQHGFAGTGIDCLRHRNDDRRYAPPRGRNPHLSAPAKTQYCTATEHRRLPHRSRRGDDRDARPRGAGHLLGEG